MILGRFRLFPVSYSSDNKPWDYICSNGFLLGLFSGELIFEGAYYWKEFCDLKLVGLGNKNSLKDSKTA